MIIPMNILCADLPKELNWSMPPSVARNVKGHVYIVTDTPSLFPKDFIAKTDGLLNSLADMDEWQIGAAIFYIFFAQADNALPTLEKIISCGGMFTSPSNYTRLPHWQNHKHCINIYNEIVFRLRGQHKISASECASIIQAIDATADLPGDYVEIGVYTGSSALAALLYMHSIGLQRQCWLLDTFMGFNYEKAKNSVDQKWYGTHSAANGRSGEALMARVKELTHGLTPDINILVFEATTASFPPGIDNIAVANLDVDMYEPTLRSLYMLAPHMQHGGIIINEDSTSAWGLPGAYYAIHQFLESEVGREFFTLRSESSYFLIRR